MAGEKREPESQDDTLEMMLEHARTLFIYHAAQRHRSLNFYFVAIAAFITALGFLWQAEVSPPVMAVVGIFLSVSAILVTLCFWQLDQRNEQLVECEVRSLKALENKILADSDLNDCHITQGWENERSGRKYRTIIPNLFRIYIGILAIGGLLISGPWLLPHLCS